MKTANITRDIVRVAVISLLALVLSTATNLQSQDKSTAAKELSTLAKNLLGTWILVGEPGKVGEPPASGGRLKFCTGRLWTVTQADPRPE